MHFGDLNCCIFNSSLTEIYVQLYICNNMAPVDQIVSEYAEPLIEPMVA